MASYLAAAQAEPEPVASGGVGDDPLDVIGHLNELREKRISALEEVIAAKWPRRWILSLRLRRCLRRSVRDYGWAGPTWHARRAAWMTDEFITRP
jgi:hypothetical protein